MNKKIATIVPRNKTQLQQSIYNQIPLSRKMGVKVLHVSARTGVQFKLPLKPNRNHKNTAFGGTLIAAQAIACWAWMMELLKQHNIIAEVVLQRQESEFVKPVAGDFTVQTLVPSKNEVALFLRTIKRHKKARLAVKAFAQYRGAKACLYIGHYVAILGDQKKPANKTKLANTRRKP